MLFLSEIKKVLLRPGFWFFGAFLDFSLSYRDNKLGIAWVYIGSVMFVIILSFLYHKLFNVSYYEYSIHLYSGLIAWNCLSGSITQSANVSQVKKGVLSITTHLNLIDFVFRAILKNYYVLVLCYAPLLALGFYDEGVKFIYYLPLIFFCLLLFLVTVTRLAILMSLLGILLRDVKEIISSIFRIGFLATPIIWMTDRITEIDSAKNTIRLYVEFNPFYHMIEVLRGHYFDRNINISIICMIGIFIFSMTISGFIYKKSKALLEMKL